MNLYLHLSMWPVSYQHHPLAALVIPLPRCQPHLPLLLWQTSTQVRDKLTCIVHQSHVCVWGWAHGMGGAFSWKLSQPCLTVGMWAALVVPPVSFKWRQCSCFLVQEMKQVALLLLHRGNLCIALTAHQRRQPPAVLPYLLWWESLHVIG